MDNQERSKKQEILALLFVILGGGGFALFIAGALVYFYSPSGLYELKYALLSPEIIGELSYQENTAYPGEKKEYIFDSFVYTYYDLPTERWKKIEVSKDQYQKFYNTIRGDSSVEEENAFITDQFLSSYPALLELYVSYKEGSDKVIKVFQKVDFAYEGNYYRVELHNGNNEKRWAYFFHENIYQLALEIFKKG